MSSPRRARRKLSSSRPNFDFVNDSFENVQFSQSHVWPFAETPTEPNIGVRDEDLYQFSQEWTLSSNIQTEHNHGLPAELVKPILSVSPDNSAGLPVLGPPEKESNFKSRSEQGEKGFVGPVSLSVPPDASSNISSANKDVSYGSSTVFRNAQLSESSRSDSLPPQLLKGRGRSKRGKSSVLSKASHPLRKQESIARTVPRQETAQESGPEETDREITAKRRPRAIPSNMSQSSHGEPRIKPDMADDAKESRPPRLDLRGYEMPSIMRSREVDGSPDWRLVGLSTHTGLPVEKGFPIQIGEELFKLSGASIMSDAPSYFSKFFEAQLQHNNSSNGGVRTLFIDRDPHTFADIARHLQGYHIEPRDGSHYVRLFADAQFYSLPRLVRQLFESEICIQIGDQSFKIHRDIFSAPGNSPNFFSLGFAVFFNSPDEVFPGLDRTGLLRPPSITPPSVPGRSAKTFSEILHLLRGYPLHIRNSEHRNELIRDCRYFNLKGLEQKLVAHDISFNIARKKTEITLRLEDIRQSGVSFSPSVPSSSSSPLAGWINYARPHVDENSYELVIEIGDEAMKIDLQVMRAELYGGVKVRITNLFQVIANKMNLPIQAPLGLMLATGGAAAQPISPGNTPLSEDKVKIHIGPDTHVLLNGEEYLAHSANGGMLGVHESAQSAGHTLETDLGSWSRTDLDDGQHPGLPTAAEPSLKKRKRQDDLRKLATLVIRKGLWRLRVQPRVEQEEGRMEIVMHAVKLDAYSEERGRNALRSFLE